MTFLNRARQILSTICFGVPLFLCATGDIAQSVRPPLDAKVMFKSSSPGKRRIVEQVLNLSLNNPLSEYELDVYNETNRSNDFRLRFRLSYEKTMRTPSIPCWVATFKEVSKIEKSEASVLGYDLLSIAGPGGDYFPKEDWAKYFCPIARPNEVLDGSFFPIKAERIFLVEGFRLSLRVTDYQYNEKENTLGKLLLTIELKNQ